MKFLFFEGGEDKEEESGTEEGREKREGVFGRKGKVYFEEFMESQMNGETQGYSAAGAEALLLY